VRAQCRKKKGEERGRKILKKRPVPSGVSVQPSAAPNSIKEKIPRPRKARKVEKRSWGKRQWGWGQTREKMKKKKMVVLGEKEKKGGRGNA